MTYTLTGNTKKYPTALLLLIFMCATLFAPVMVMAAGTKKIGDACDGSLDGNQSCVSGDCEDSSKDIDADDFCDCDDDNDCKLEYGQANPNVTSWECWDGAHATYDLDYCVGTIPGSKSIVKYPIDPRDPGFVDKLLDPQITLDEIQKKISTPQPRITIPGLEFSKAQAVMDRGKTYMIFPFLGEYIAAIYRYAVVVASALAVLVIIVSGIQWMLPGNLLTSGEGDSKQTTNQAKKRIGGALVGLTIAVGSYTILYLVNPELVKFKNLRVEVIEKIPVPIEAQLTDNFGGYSSLPPNFALEASEIIDGGFRGRMMDACGTTKNGFALTTYQERQERLKEIIKVWKTEGLDKAGAVYIRGGSPGCTYFHIDHGWTFNVMASLYKKEPSLFTSMPTPCKDPVAIASSLGYKSRIKLKNKGPTQCSAPKGPWNNLYKTLAVDRAKSAGLLCGDCASFLRTLFFKCFDNSGYTTLMPNRFNKYRPKNLKNGKCRPEGAAQKDTRYVFQLNEKDNITDRELNALQFGDVIAWKGRSGGHVMLYTGRKGLGYEILEMGGGGRADVQGGGQAGKHAKIPWRISGMRAHTSAKSYLQATKNKSPKCMYAFRPLKG